LENANIYFELMNMIPKREI